jgi:hypothetical protein
MGPDGARPTLELAGYVLGTPAEILELRYVLLDELERALDAMPVAVMRLPDDPAVPLDAHFPPIPELVGYDGEAPDLA